MKCYLLLKLPFASTVKHFYIHNFVDSILVSDVQVSMHNGFFSETCAGIQENGWDTIARRIREISPEVKKNVLV